MQIEITELEHCKLSVHYEADKTEIAAKKEEVLQAFKKAPVPGFRPEKADMNAIRLHYAKQIDESLKRALAESSYHETLFQKELRPHGSPHFTSVLLESGKFICEFQLSVRPNFDLPEWKGYEIPKPHSELTTSEVAEKMMQELRVRLGEATPYSETDFVQKGDNVIIDYEGSIDNKKIESLCAENEMMSVGNSPLTGFDDNLLGMKIGDQREFDFTAPEGGLPSLSGKSIHFKATLATGSKTTPCPLDDSLAQKMGKTTLVELQEAVGQTAFARVANHQQIQLNEAVAKRLVADTTVQVPNFMSLSEAQYLAHQSELNWETMADADKEKMLTMAEANVKLTLILDKIREIEPEAQLTEQEIFEIIKQNLAQMKTNQTMDEMIQQMNKTGQLQILFQRIKDEQVLAFVCKTIKVVE
jgi:trigger factor